MNTSNIRPEKVIKPIQLLAAWLLGLVLINTSFLTAATQITIPVWGAGALIIATIANVPIFLLSLFMLQTKFRPEMQEDTYYSQYLERKYSGDKKSVSKIEIDTDAVVKEIIAKIDSTKKPLEKEKEIKQILRERDTQLIKNEVGGSRTLSELFLYPERWEEIVDSWGEDPFFIKDIQELYKYDLISGNLKRPKTLKLTELGKEISTDLKENNKLWNQIQGIGHLKN